jgi:hypothetical protein
MRRRTVSRMAGRRDRHRARYATLRNAAIAAVAAAGYHP